MIGIQPWSQQKNNPELQSAIIRFFIWAITFVYLVRPDFPALYGNLFLIYLGIYVAVFVSVLFLPCSLVRRYLMILIDISAVSFVLLFQGTVFSPLLLIYVWIYIGYGFRYGIRFLLVAAVYTLAGFAVVAALVNAWTSDTFSTALTFAVLGLLPLYQYSLQKKLEQAKAAAEIANRVKTDFLATISHELRTPLTTIVGMGRLLADSGLSGQQAEYVSSLRAAGGVLRTRIQEILDVARIEAQELALEARDFVPEQSFLDVARSIADIARRKDLAFHAWISPRLPGRLTGDELRLRQILHHLLDNAVKFTEEGEVRLRMEWEPATTGSGGRLRLRVEDTGIGMSPDKLGHIFERFWQGDSSLARRRGGFGLGTTVVRHLVDLMGGEIAVASVPGQGTSFDVLIPFGPRSVAPPSPTLRRPGARGVLVDAAGEFESAMLVDYCHFLGLEVDRTPAEGTQSAAARADAVLVAGDGRPGFETRLANWRGLSGGRYAVIAVCSRTSCEAEPPGLQTPFVAGDLGRILRQVLADAAAPAAEASGTDAGATPAAGTGQAEGGGRVLVVEDDPDIARLIEALLDLRGYRPEVCSDGLQALERFDDGFDLLLVDLRMPRMDGQALAREWRTREQAADRARIPVVALTADTLESVRQATLAAGMDDFLTKPVEPEELYAVLARYLRAEGRPKTAVEPAAVSLSRR